MRTNVLPVDLHLDRIATVCDLHTLGSPFRGHVHETTKVTNRGTISTIAWICDLATQGLRAIGSCTPMEITVRKVLTAAYFSFMGYLMRRILKQTLVSKISLYGCSVGRALKPY